jgi:hypothetical protein
MWGRHSVCACYFRQTQARAGSDAGNLMPPLSDKDCSRTRAVVVQVRLRLPGSGEVANREVRVQQIGKIRIDPGVQQPNDNAAAFRCTPVLDPAEQK